MVTDMTTPDFVPAMKKAVAIVTNKGGQTSHAAIVSRELGVPAVVGTEKATTAISTGTTFGQPACVKPLKPTLSSCLMSDAASSALINFNAI